MSQNTNENPQNQNQFEQGSWEQSPEQTSQASPAQGQPPYAQGYQAQSSYAPPQTQVPPTYGYYTPGAPVAFAPQLAKKSRGWIVALVTVVLLFCLCAMGMHSCTTAMTSLGGSSSYTSSSIEVDMLTSDAVGIITLDGTIQYDGTVCSPEGFKQQLDVAANNPHIVALVLRVDSGGGTATAGEEMTTYLREFMEETGKPVVVSSASMNASAAYEISSQADYIYVAQSSAVGSIGTALQVTDISELLDKLGINIENITSSDSKDSSYGTRALTEEERQAYQKMVTQINDMFIATVAEGREMTEEEVRALANGMTYTGLDCIQNGLADEIGTLEDAVEKAAELASISGYTTVNLETDYYDMSSLLELLMAAQSSGNATDADIEAFLKELEADGILSQ